MKLSDFAPVSSTVLRTNPSNGSFKNSTILFDTKPGTRTWTAPATGITTVRVFVLGGGGANLKSGGGYEEYVFTPTPSTSYSYTVGAGGVPSATETGGTSSFNATITATGGTDASTPGVGSGGLVSSSGGLSNGSSGHRFGNGGDGGGQGGGGWGQRGSSSGGNAMVDGFGLGLIPGIGGESQSVVPGGPSPVGGGGPTNGGYGAGGGAAYSATSSSGGNGGVGGGGGGLSGNGGIGGAGAATGYGGNGCVGIEVLS